MSVGQVPVNVLATADQLSSPDVIKTGQKIYSYNADKYYKKSDNQLETTGHTTLKSFHVIFTLLKNNSLNSLFF